MSKPALALVQKETGVDKQKALETALGNIERSFGKGSVMRLGDKKSMDIEAVSTGSLGLDIALGIGGFRKAGSSRFSGRKARARRRWRCIASPKRRRTGASAPSLTPSTHSIRSMPASLASILMTF
jgi:hypothetical protein